MNKGKKNYDKITKFIKLTAIWIIRILFSKSHFKVPLHKRIYYAINGGFMADQIALYNLNKKNKNEYLSEFDWYKSRYINEPYNFILNNKVVCADLLRQYTNVPDTYYIKRKGEIFSYNNLESTLEGIIELLKSKNKLILKPINIGKGIGVVKLEYKDNKFYFNNTKFSKKEIIEYLNSKDNWFISEYIEQSKELNNLFKDSTNTIRLITVRNPKNQKCEVLYAVQRIGTNETIPVDNGSKGGLVSKIDLETGVLSSAKSIQRKCNYDKHPNNNSKIKDIRIKNWIEIKEHYTKLMEQLPYLYFVAWDILVTDNGPVLIEANTSSGVNIIQLWGGQRKNELGNFYKQHKIIKK